MRYCFTLLFIFTLFFASSCKKNDDAGVPPSDGLDSLQSNGFKFNYVSIQIDGKSYVCKDNRAGSFGWGNTNVNRKIESIGISGIKLDQGAADSLLFWREYTLSNDSTLYMNVLFCKKMAKKDCLLEQGFFYPKDQLELFRPGLQGFATDFKRENSYDGIGIRLSLKEGDKYISYSSYSMQYPSSSTTITNASQKGSYFDITKVAFIQKGDYIEAKFKAKIFNLKEESRTIDKGFLRLHIGSFTKQ